MPHPSVTIGLAAYNGAEWLSQTLATLLAQDFHDFELIIGDDASTDATPEVCSEWARRDPRIRVIRHQENLGPLKNHEFLLAASGGEYFMWSNDHDLYPPSYVRRCLTVLEACPEVVLCCGKTIAFTTLEGAMRPLEVPLDTRGLTLRDRFVAMVQASVRDACAFYGLFRASVLRRASGHRRTYGGDLIFLAEMALLGDVVRLDDLPYCRRKFEGGTPEAGKARWVRNIIRPKGHALGAEAAALDMAYEYLQMILETTLPKDVKNELMAVSLELTMGSFGNMIRDEVEAFVPKARAALGSGGLLEADFAKEVLAYTLKAGLVLGWTPALEQLRGLCLAVLAPVNGPIPATMTK